MLRAGSPSHISITLIVSAPMRHKTAVSLQELDSGWSRPHCQPFCPRSSPSFSAYRLKSEPQGHSSRSRSRSQSRSQSRSRETHLSCPADCSAWSRRSRRASPGRCCRLVSWPGTLRCRAPCTAPPTCCDCWVSRDLMTHSALLPGTAARPVHWRQTPEM